MATMPAVLRGKMQNKTMNAMIILALLVNGDLWGSIYKSRLIPCFT